MTNPIEKTNLFVEMLSMTFSLLKESLGELKKYKIQIALFAIIFVGAILYAPLDNINLEFKMLNREYLSIVFMFAVALILTDFILKIWSFTGKYIKSEYLKLKLLFLPKKEKWILGLCYQMRYSSLYDTSKFTYYYPMFRFNTSATPFLTSLYCKGIFTQLDESLYYKGSVLNDDVRKYLLLTKGKCLGPKDDQEVRDANDFLNEVSNISEILNQLNELQQNRENGL